MMHRPAIEALHGRTGSVAAGRGPARSGNRAASGSRFGAFRLRRRLLAAAAALVIAGQAQAATLIQPAPYQMVRSLRNLQDKVASGKAEALPLLRLLLVRIGKQFGEVDPGQWDEPRNQYAAITYLLNGGNPDAVRAVLAHAKTTPAVKEILHGAIAYAEGDQASVVKTFAGLKPGELPFDLLDSIYLVSAAPLAETDPLAALGRLDYVRLTAPGSLLEEAAIRRSLALAGKVGDVAKFRLIARDYLQRFGASPYLQDFLVQCVKGLVAHKGKITDEQIAKTAGFALEPVRLSLYLRLARAALLDGQPARAQFAAGKADALAAKRGATSLQAQLYGDIGGVATTGAGIAAKRLATIPRDKLHPADAVLLDAALVLAKEITTPPSPADVTVPVNQPAVENTAKRQADTEAFNSTVSEARSALSQIDKLLGVKAR